MTLDSPALGEQANNIPIQSTLKTIATLFKARIVFLLVLASLGGAFLGVGGIPNGWTLLALIITGALAAGGSSAINQYIERDSDTKMGRTEARPLASGQIEDARGVLAISIGMIALAVLGTLPFNPVMAFYLLLGAIIYVAVYTLWLKPRSILNIVIGGAAGSCAVMTGGAAVGAAAHPSVITLALVVFLWTPAHFWALAMYYKDDYAASSTPMLPVLVPDKQTSWWIFIHAAGTSLATLLLAVDPALGLVYLVPVGIVTLIMMRWGVLLIREPDRKHAIRLFVASNIFLLVVFVIIIATTAGRHLLS